MKTITIASLALAAAGTVHAMPAGQPQALPPVSAQAPVAPVLRRAGQPQALPPVAVAAAAVSTDIEARDAAKPDTKCAKTNGEPVDQFTVRSTYYTYVPASPSSTNFAYNISLTAFAQTDSANLTKATCQYSWTADKKVNTFDSQFLPCSESPYSFQISKTAGSAYTIRLRYTTEANSTTGEYKTYQGPLNFNHTSSDPNAIYCLDKYYPSTLGKECRSSKDVDVAVLKTALKVATPPKAENKKTTKTPVKTTVKTSAKVKAKSS